MCKSLQVLHARPQPFSRKQITKSDLGRLALIDAPQHDGFFRNQLRSVFSVGKKYPALLESLPNGGNFKRQILYDTVSQLRNGVIRHALSQGGIIIF